MAAPNTIPNLAFWLDGNIGLFSDTAGTIPATNGGTVARWNDQSGAANNATQATAANQPFLRTNYFGGTRNGLEFSTHFLSQAFNPGGPWTLFAVYKTLVQGPIAGGSNGNAQVVHQSNNGLQISNTSFICYPQPGSNANSITLPTKRQASVDPPLTVVIQSASSDNSTFSKNRTLGSEVGSVTGMTFTSLTIGTNLSTADVVIAEVIGYSRALTSAEINTVEAYLAAKYATVIPQFVIFNGNSLTAGAHASPGNDYANVVLNSLPNGSIFCYNEGVAGNYTLQLQTAFLAQNNAAYMSLAKQNIEIFWELTNDLAYGPNTGNPTAAYNAYVTYATARQDAVNRPNLKLCLMTCLPRNGITEPVRNACNNLLRADFTVPTQYPLIFKANPGVTYAQYLVDVGNDPVIGQAGQNLNTTYYYTDQVHLIDAGYAIIAGYAENAIALINGIFPPSPVVTRSSPPGNPPFMPPVFPPGPPTKEKGVWEDGPGAFVNPSGTGLAVYYNGQNQTSLIVSATPKPPRQTSPGAAPPSLSKIP